MAQATIALKLEKNRFVFGESCVALATIDNAGDQPLPLEKGVPVSPLIFSFRLDGNPEPRYILSERAWMESRSRGILKKQPLEKAAKLQPGKQKKLQTDLVELNPEPFLPGKYSVTASMEGNDGEISSAPVEIEVVPASIGLIARSVSRPRKRASTVFVHKEEDDKFTLYHQLSDSESLNHSIFYPAAKTGPVTSIATAIDAVDIQGGRRIAWLEGNHLKSLEIWGSRITKPLSTCPLEIPQGELVNPGVQFADGSACFAVAAGAALALYRVRRSEWTLEATGSLGAAQPEGLRLEVEAEGKTLRFLWASAGKLWSWRFSLGLQPIEGEPTEFAAGEGPLVAWNKDCAVRGTVKDGFSVYGGLLPIPLAPLPGESVGMAIGPGLETPLAAQAGARLYFCVPGKGAWREVAKGVKPIGSAEVFSVDGRRYFAQGIEPGAGVRFLLLPKT